MNELTMIQGLTTGVKTTEEVVRELDKISEILFHLEVPSFELFSAKSDIWFKVCQVRNKIWFENNMEVTRAKLAELSEYILSFAHSLAQ